MDVIVDIDGTVADCRHRLHWISSKPKNWKAFYAAVSQDVPIIPVITVIRRLAHSSGDRIIYCSGRPESTGLDTVRWIKKHVGVEGPLYMRADGDFRSDDVVKEELLAKIRQDGRDPFMVFDDRKRVKQMWVRNGLFVFDVNQHDVEF